MSNIKERAKNLIRVGHNAYKEVIELPLIFCAFTIVTAAAILPCYKVIHEFSKQIDKPFNEITVPRNTLIMAIVFLCLAGFFLGMCIKCVIDHKNSKNHSLENKIDNLGQEVYNCRMQLKDYQKGTSAVSQNTLTTLTA